MEKLEINLTPELVKRMDDVVDLLDLDQALTDLAQHDERKVRVVEMRFFGGLLHAEIGEALGISPKTVEADWYFARAWLGARLGAVRDTGE